MAWLPDTNVWISLLKNPDSPLEDKIHCAECLVENRPSDG